VNSVAVLDEAGRVVNIVVVDHGRFRAPDGCEFVALHDGATVVLGQQFDWRNGCFLPVDEAPE